ncbi:type VI secretion system baseplate subunit TssK [Francisella frigiditurris]|uniref:Uncharacterized protein n=1 Tax=Francisella frigiditurris TaxID=1542390 RepID=A0A1J0KRU5_9GAMM|nr:type VI secretion system baseplate subunit TssK [Francisella frigiditurris]APC96504.1 hypothetical protein KX01_1288 [Francisella frigiditurris]
MLKKKWFDGGILTAKDLNEQNNVNISNIYRNTLIPFGLNEAIFSLKINKQKLKNNIFEIESACIYSSENELIQIKQPIQLNLAKLETKVDDFIDIFINTRYIDENGGYSFSEYFLSNIREKFGIRIARIRIVDEHVFLEKIDIPLLSLDAHVFDEFLDNLASDLMNIKKLLNILQNVSMKDIYIINKISYLLYILSQRDNIKSLISPFEIYKELIQIILYIENFFMFHNKEKLYFQINKPVSSLEQIGKFFSKFNTFLLDKKNVDKFEYDNNKHFIVNVNQLEKNKKIYIIVTKNFSNGEIDINNIDYLKISSLDRMDIVKNLSLEGIKKRKSILEELPKSLQEKYPSNGYILELFECDELSHCFSTKSMVIFHVSKSLKDYSFFIHFS